MDRQGVLLKGSGNPEFGATSHTCCFCALTHSLFIHSFETEPRYSTGLHGSQSIDKAGLERQRFASALSAGIKCMPPCLTSPGITDSPFRGQLWLDHNSPQEGTLWSFNSETPLLGPLFLSLLAPPEKHTGPRVPAGFQELWVRPKPS